VDDDRITRKIMRKSLATLGHSLTPLPHEATTGEDLLLYLSQHKHDHPHVLVSHASKSFPAAEATDRSYAFRWLQIVDENMGAGMKGSAAIALLHELLAGAEDWDVVNDQREAMRRGTCLVALHLTRDAVARDPLLLAWPQVRTLLLSNSFSEAELDEVREEVETAIEEKKFPPRPESSAIQVPPPCPPSTRCPR